MVDIHVETTVEAPLAEAFAYTANYRNVPQWLYGIQEFVPHGEVDYGLGAVFDGKIHLGATLNSRIEIQGFAENSLIEFDSIKGFKNSAKWTFTAHGEDHTLIVADVSYQLPLGIAGKALGKVIEPFVKIAVKHSSAALKEHIEA